jgi:hypothetical protein
VDDTSEPAFVTGGDHTTVLHFDDPIQKGVTVDNGHHQITSMSFDVSAVDPTQTGHGHVVGHVDIL